MWLLFPDSVLSYNFTFKIVKQNMNLKADEVLNAQMHFVNFISLRHKLQMDFLFQIFCKKNLFAFWRQHCDIWQWIVIWPEFVLGIVFNSCVFKFIQMLLNLLIEILPIDKRQLYSDSFKLNGAIGDLYYNLCMIENPLFYKFVFVLRHFSNLNVCFVYKYITGY